MAASEAENGEPERLRLFFALWPSESVRADLAAVARQWRRSPRFSGRGTRPERYHITLAFLGDVSRGEELDRVFAVGAGMSTAAFELRLDHVGCFGRRHRWIGWVAAGEVPEALLALNRQLARALRENGLPCDNKTFRPHVTLFRDLGRRPPRDLAVNIDWPLDEFVLVSSALPPKPAEYTILARYALEVAHA